LCISFFLKHVAERREKGGENDEENAISFWMSLRTPENDRN